jgi:hypothetical protein
MKNLKYTVLIIFIGTLFTNCTKKLDQFPSDQISSPTFWKTQSDALLGLNGCYAISSGFAYNFWYYDGASDNSFDQYPWESYSTAISAGNITAASVNGIGGLGNGDYDYTSIRRFNTFLDNVDNVSMDASLKSEYKGEVRFLRAYNYFLLAEMFGDVPLVIHANTITENDLKPAKEADVITFVLGELDSASNVLPLTATDLGRATKGAALSLKARVQLFYQNWAGAAATAQQIMSMNQYSLFKTKSLTAADMADDYSSFVTFANDADKQKFYLGLRSYQNMYAKQYDNGNPEFIFETQYIASAQYQYDQTKENGLNTLFLPSDLGGWSSITPTQELVDAYWNRDGSAFAPISALTRAANYNYPNSPLPAYYNEFKNRDTRLYASIFFTGNIWNGLQSGYSYTWGKGGSNNSATGYNFRKMVDPAYISQPEFVGGQSYPLIRYAEVLLTYAEAKNELSGPDASVFDALDSIRSRAGMPFTDRVANNSQAALRNLIRNERRIELAAEGLRYFDIRRWNIAPNVMKTEIDVTNNIAQSRVWMPKFMKLPYPQTAVDRNSNLTAAQAAKGY